MFLWWLRMQEERLEKATDWIPLNESKEWAMCKNKKDKRVTSLKVQWLRLHASNAGDTGSNPGQGTKISHARKESLVTQLCPTLCDPKDCSLPGSSVHGILQARILEWVPIPFSSGSSQPSDWTQISYIAGRFFTFLSHQRSQEEWTKDKTPRIRLIQNIIVQFYINRFVTV